MTMPQSVPPKGSIFEVINQAKNRIESDHEELRGMGDPVYPPEYRPALCGPHHHNAQVRMMCERYRITVPFFREAYKDTCNSLGISPEKAEINANNLLKAIRNDKVTSQRLIEFATFVCGFSLDDIVVKLKDDFGTDLEVNRDGTSIDQTRPLPMLSPETEDLRNVGDAIFAGVTPSKEAHHYDTFAIALCERYGITTPFLRAAYREIATHYGIPGDVIESRIGYLIKALKQGGITLQRLLELINYVCGLSLDDIVTEFTDKKGSKHKVSLKGVKKIN